MSYAITAAIAAALLLLPEPCFRYDFNQATHVLNQQFYQDQFWQMPSEARSGTIIFVTKHDARQRAVLVPIPVMGWHNKPLAAASISCPDLQADNSMFLAFILNRTTPVSIMQASSLAPTGYMTSISNDQEDLAVQALYQAYLNHRNTFFYCTEPVGCFAYLDQGQLYTWDAGTNKFRILAH